MTFDFSPEKEDAPDDEDFSLPEKVEEMSNTVSTETREASVEGTMMRFTAHFNEDGERTILWKVGNRRGTDGRFDYDEHMFFLPQGETVFVNERERSSIEVPQWVVDGIRYDFLTMIENDEGVPLQEWRSL